MKEGRTRSLALGNAPALAIRNEAARHPFRRALPRELVAHIENQAVEKTGKQSKKWMSEDMSLFLLSFTAFFTAFSAFIF
ncbi:hypothetical protein [Parasphingorhabdus sp.]|uniref:hypothetical protein n=1 Tax=Parasphingorhabdus sp. TaxID=2709688 RepID=UPI002F9349D9